MIKIKRTLAYLQSLSELLEKKPELAEEIDNRVDWFKRNPNDTRLRNHELIKRMKGKWAFSIDGDVRIVYRWKGKNEVEFLAIGGHGKVYGKK
jgi:mRNA-degrading endonuclease YafQ of YafQ-DinJ toxin-antitoxin module